MAASFQFELVSPEKLVVSQPVAMVTVPGGEGDYGVLAGHAPLITTVRPGVIDVYGQEENEVTERIFVAGGFAEVTQDRCTVLAEFAVPVAELDRTKIEDNIKVASDVVAAASSDIEKALADKQLAVARAQLQAITQ